MTPKEKINALIKSHWDELKATPHPTRSRAKRGSTMLGYAMHLSSSDLAEPTLLQGLSILRAAVGESRASGRHATGPRPCTRHTALDGRLASAVSDAASRLGETMQTTADVILASADACRAPDEYVFERGWNVRLSDEVHAMYDRERGVGRDMSWVLAQALGVDLS